LFERGIGAVGRESFESAGLIVAWPLNEPRRFFGELALPVEIANAVRLDTWLLEYCKRKRVTLIGKNHVRRHGPLRDKALLDAAIKELVELNRIQLSKEEKRLIIKINPALLSGDRP